MVTKAKVIGSNGAESIVDLPLTTIQKYLEKNRLITVIPITDEASNEGEVESPEDFDNVGPKRIIKRTPKDVFSAK